jgi:hypothetical protein
LQFGAKIAGQSPYRIIREEQVFICRRCAEARMRANAWVVLFGCGPLALAIGILLLGFSLFGSLGILGATAAFVWAAFRQLRYVRRQGYLRQGFPDTSVTKMAINLRKKAIVKELGLINATELRFFTEVERRRLGL